MRLLNAGVSLKPSSAMEQMHLEKSVFFLKGKENGNHQRLSELFLTLEKF